MADPNGIPVILRPVRIVLPIAFPYRIPLAVGKTPSKTDATLSELENPNEFKLLKAMNRDLSAFR